MCPAILDTTTTTETPRTQKPHKVRREKVVHTRCKAILDTDLVRTNVCYTSMCVQPAVTSMGAHLVCGTKLACEKDDARILKRLAPSKSSRSEQRWCSWQSARLLRPWSGFKSSRAQIFFKHTTTNNKKYHTDANTTPRDRVKKMYCVHTRWGPILVTDLVRTNVCYTSVGVQPPVTSMHGSPPSMWNTIGV